MDWILKVAADCRGATFGLAMVGRSTGSVGLDLATVASLTVTGPPSPGPSHDSLRLLAARAAGARRDRLPPGLRARLAAGTLTAVRARRSLARTQEQTR